MGFSYYVYIGPYAQVPHQKKEVDDGQKHFCVNENCSQYSKDKKEGEFCSSCGVKLKVVQKKRERTIWIEDILESLGMDYNEVEDRFHDLSRKEGMEVDFHILTPNHSLGMENERKSFSVCPRDEECFDEMKEDAIKKEKEAFCNKYKKELTLLKDKFGDELKIKFGVISFAW